ncbi:MAG: hypothetical protein AB7D06_17075 [Pedobacter sp.]
MCDCRKTIEKKLLDKFRQDAPEAKDHTSKLTGYAFIFGESVMEKGVMPIEQTAKFPLKKGGMKERKIKINMMFTYCPFCGEKYA